MKAISFNYGKNLMKVIMALPVVCLIVFPPWELARAWLAPLSDSVQEQVDAAIDYGFDGMIVYVDREWLGARYKEH